MQAPRAVHVHAGIGRSSYPSSTPRNLQFSVLDFQAEWTDRNPAESEPYHPTREQMSTLMYDNHKHYHREIKKTM